MPKPNWLLLIGFILVVFGWIVPFLTTAQIIPSNLILLFISFFASVAGLFLGVIGIAMIAAKRKRLRDQQQDEYKK
jgi:heme/copper-type cytochrome/quinol oxidase subunit 2